MVARMVFQMTMMVIVVALAVHMIVQRSHAQATQVVAATKIAQPAPKVSSVAAVQPRRTVMAAAVVVPQVKSAATVGMKNVVPSVKTTKTAVLGHNSPDTLEVANLPGSGEVVR